MKIGINGFEAVIPRFGYDKSGLPNRVGSSEVCFELLSQLSKIDKKNKYSIFLPVPPTADLPTESENWHYEVIPDSKLWTVVGLGKKLLYGEKFDVFFSPTHYGPLITRSPEVVSVLDVSYKYFPELFKKKDLAQLSIWGKYSIKKASKIITISNSSKSDIIKEYGVANEKIAVVYLGVKENNKTKMKASEVLEKHNIKKPYLLFVGTLQPRKNISRLIEAFSQIVKGHKNLSLVVVGRRGWQFEEILNSPLKFGVAESVRFLENVNDDELPSFYENAEAFVLPSLYEGFGLPVLEAMKYNCPVATSDISSLPEAGGDAAVYFDPYDTHDMAEKVGKILSNSKLRSEMVKKGHAQVKKFSWEKSAREVLKVLEEVGGKNAA